MSSSLQATDQSLACVADLGVVCLLAAPWVQLFTSADNGWPHNPPSHHLLDWSTT